VAESVNNKQYNYCKQPSKMSNALHGNIGHWISDGSDGNLVQENVEMKASSVSQGTPFNVLYQVDVGVWSSIYFVVEIKKLNGSLSVGVVKRNEFLPGWKTTGMFYNGNVTNGSSALTVRFGESLSSGGTVGVYVRRNESELRVTIYRNNQCLGTAFQLSNIDEFFFPCVQVSGSVTFLYSAPIELPKSTDREYPKALDRYLGEWKMDEATKDSKSVDIPNDLNIIFSVSPGKAQGMYALGVKVANQIHTTVEKVGKDEEFDLIQVGPVISTRMMPPPHLWEMEKFIVGSLEKIRKMSVVNEDVYVLVGAEVEIKCTRFYETFSPLHSYK
jgi:hypothetical protein